MKNISKIVCVTFIACNLVASVLAQDDSDKASDSLYFPTDNEWETVDFETAGAKDFIIESAIDFAGRKNSKGVIILWNGKILAEKYWDGWDQDSTGPAYSASKSVVSSLIGMAIEQSHIESVDQSASDFLDEWQGKTGIRENQDQTLVIHDRRLARRRGDFRQRETCRETNANSRHHCQLPTSRGLNGTITTRPIDFCFPSLNKPPETRCKSFPKCRCFDKIGMANSSWSVKRRAPSNYTFLRCSPRDMARYGLLVLAEGQWEWRTDY